VKRYSFTEVFQSRSPIQWQSMTMTLFLHKRPRTEPRSAETLSKSPNNSLI